MPKKYFVGKQPNLDDKDQRKDLQRADVMLVAPKFWTLNTDYTAYLKGLTLRYELDITFPDGKRKPYRLYTYPDTEGIDLAKNFIETFDKAGKCITKRTQFIKGIIPMKK
jgi:hypothetical protein